MASGLEHLLAEGIIDEVLGRLKSGKEADVYAVRFGGKVVAAKIYKERAHRSFKNNALYQEGRSVRNSRSQRAMNRKTSFGQAAAEAAWKSAEADALYKLHAAQVRVPHPVMFLEGVLLMELVLGEDGEPAPRVVDTAISPAKANAAYHDMLGQLVKILSCDLIHGDLSPYNVLWGVAGPTIIDFPQIISAAQNSLSEGFFLRDARNILGHFASIDRSLMSRSGDANEIWRAYIRRELTPEFVPQGRAVAPHSPRSAPSEARRSGRTDVQGGIVGGPRPQGPHAGPRPNGPQAGPRSYGPQVGPRPNGPQAGPRSHGPRSNEPSPRSGNGRRQPHVPEVIIRIARTPRPDPPHDDHGTSSTGDAALSPPARHKSRG